MCQPLNLNLILLHNSRSLFFHLNTAFSLYSGLFFPEKFIRTDAEDMYSCTVYVGGVMMNLR